jgi:hypothetical protein
MVVVVVVVASVVVVYVVKVRGGECAGDGGRGAGWRLLPRNKAYSTKRKLYQGKGERRGALEGRWSQLFELQGRGRRVNSACGLEVTTKMKKTSRKTRKGKTRKKKKKKRMRRTLQHPGGTH